MTNFAQIPIHLMDTILIFTMINDFNWFREHPLSLSNLTLDASDGTTQSFNKWITKNSNFHLY